MLAESLRRTAEELSPAQCALYRSIPDPAGEVPMCEPGEFPGIVDGFVADFAPRLFAIVQEYGDRVDMHIAAWGIAFDDRADIISATGCTVHKGLSHPRDALPFYCYGPHVTAHLVWFNAAATTLRDTDDADDAE